MFHKNWLSKLMILKIQLNLKKIEHKLIKVMKNKKMMQELLNKV